MSEDVLERANSFASELNEADRQRRIRDLGALHLIHALAAEVRALRKDRERLDFIITKCSGLDFPSEQHADAFFSEIAKHEDMLVGFRAAFDAALSARGGEDGA